MLRLFQNVERLESAKRVKQIYENSMDECHTTGCPKKSWFDGVIEALKNNDNRNIRIRRSCNIRLSSLSMQKRCVRRRECAEVL